MQVASAQFMVRTGIDRVRHAIWLDRRIEGSASRDRRVLEQLWVRWIAGPATCGILVGCSSADLTARVSADHTLGDVAVSSVQDGTPLARQAASEARGSRADADRRATVQVSRPVLHHSVASWVASVSVPRGSGEGLPSIFVEPISLNFDDAATGGMVGLRTMADRIAAVTGVPVRLQPDVFSGAEAASHGNASASIASPVPLPSLSPPPALSAPPLPLTGLATLPGILQPPTNTSNGRRELSIQSVPMRWSGSLEGYLNMVTDRLGLAWEYRDGVAVIERFRTEYLEIASLDGEVDYKLGLNGNDQATANNSTSSTGGGATSSASANSEISERGKANVAAAILSAVQQIVKDAPGSSVVRLDGSGRIAVTSTRDTLARVGDFVRAENESLLRQAQVQFDIYSVMRNETDERGIDWEAVLSALGGAYTGTVQSPETLTGALAGNVGFAILTPSQSGVRNSVTTHFGGSSAILKMLNDYGGSTQHREVSLLALNRTWDRKSSLGGRAYVSSTVPGASSTTGVGAPGLVTSTVTTGDRYLAQPYILDNDTVLLKFGIGLSSLVNIANFTSGTGSTEQTVQTPETTAIDDQATVALKAGQILVITGLSRIVSSEDRRGLWDQAPTALGGSRTQGRMREEFVIFVRPTIL
jgi:type IVB pilus formation R64 PilN family outer membrane protein